MPFDIPSFWKNRQITPPCNKLNSRHVRTAEFLGSAHKILTKITVEQHATSSGYKNHFEVLLSMVSTDHWMLSQLRIAVGIGIIQESMSAYLIIKDKEIGRPPNSFGQHIVSSFHVFNRYASCVWITIIILLH